MQSMREGGSRSKPLLREKYEEEGWRWRKVVRLQRRLQELVILSTSSEPVIYTPNPLFFRFLLGHIMGEWSIQHLAFIAQFGATIGSHIQLQLFPLLPPWPVALNS
jgi:hypothetical protein